MSRPRRATAEASAAMTVWPDPVDGTGWGLRIQRRHEPRDWPRQLEKVPEEHRAGAEEYLRGIAARMRVIRRLKELPDGPPSSS
jgi:hypothetical protein